MLPVFSGVRVAHLPLLLCMYDFSCFMFFVVYVCFPCLVNVPWLHSFDYRYNLGPLIILSMFVGTEFFFTFQTLIAIIEKL